MSMSPGGELGASLKGFGPAEAADMTRTDGVDRVRIWLAGQAEPGGNGRRVAGAAAGPAAGPGIHWLSGGC